MPNSVYDIPNGGKNLVEFFPGVDFTAIQDYYLEILSGGETIATTPINRLDGECCDDKIRVYFVNYMGRVDAINFKPTSIEHEPKSDSWKRPTQAPLTDKTLHSNQRFNVKANDIYTLTNHDYPEADLGWLDELKDSPLAWMDFTSLQGEADGYLPIVILDSKTEKRRENDRYYYETIIQIQPSHERFIIRN